MSFGILDVAPGRGDPPGTALLEEVPSGTKHAHAVLVPQPSSSPRDPLNMSTMRKEAHFLALIYGACITGVVGPVLVPGFSIVAAAFQIDLNKVTLLNGSLVMALGVSSYLCGPLATICGRRLVYLVTTLIMLFGCVWAGQATSYGSLIGSRTFQGLGMGAFFSLAGTSSINDVFFVHQRGRRAGLWNFAVIVSVNVAPIISGYLITGLSWEWSFRILAIAFAVAFVLVFAFMPETSFDRETLTGLEPSSSVAISGEEGVVANKEGGLKSSDADADDVSASKVSAASTTKPTLVTRFLGINNVEFKPLSQLLPMLASPLGLLSNPVVLWACAMWAVTFSWTIILGAVADQIFEAPPFLLSPISVGLLIGIPPLIGSALGTVSGGWMCDWAAKFMSIRNNGIYEPEFRLVVQIPALITTAIGTFGLGIAIDDGLSMWACAVFLGFLNFGIGVGCTGIIAYQNDVCGTKAADAFGVAMLVKSAFAFGLTFMLNDYYAAHGARVFFITFGALTTGVTLTTIPLYVFGKRIRSYCLV